MNFKISSESCGFGSEIDGCQNPGLYRGLGELLWRHREHPLRPWSWVLSVVLLARIARRSDFILKYRSITTDGGQGGVVS